VDVRESSERIRADLYSRLLWYAASGADALGAGVPQSRKGELAKGKNADGNSNVWTAVSIASVF
jgi:hypothetical protein